MSYYKNLVPGQYQIGDIVFGKGTNIIVETFDPKPYDLNAQDYQVSRADETRFGFDQLKPSTIEITMEVLYNSLLPLYKSAIPNFWQDMPDVPDLVREWKFDEGRYVWNQLKPLYVCGQDKIPKIVFGRPGQFGGESPTTRATSVKCVGEFRRADTYSYGISEKGALLTSAVPNQVINGTAGEGPSWMRILLAGPMVHPILTFTNMYQQAAPVVVNLNYNLAAGETVEISSYPWSRRSVSSTGENLSSYQIGDTPYLDRLRFAYNSVVNCNLAATGMTGASQALVLYRDSYQYL